LREARFDVAVLLNITPDHLDRHGGLEGYVAAKRHLFDQLPADGTAIIGLDDETTRGVAQALGRTVLSRGVTGISAYRPVVGGVYVDDGRLIDARNGSARTILDLAEAPALPGSH